MYTYVNSLLMPAAYTYPLDIQNGSAAFGLVKLRSAYAGSALRLRRASDDAETDIGFSGFMLDTAAMFTHCAGGINGYVVTLYDQTGNARDVTQGTKLNQPQIISAGGLAATIGGKPAMICSVTGWLAGTTATQFITNTEGTAFYSFHPTSITQNNASPSANHIIWGDNGGWVGTALKATPVIQCFGTDSGEVSADQAIVNAMDYVGVWQHTGGTVSNFLNSATAGASTALGATGMTTSVFRVANNATGDFEGYLSTLLTYSATVAGANLDAIGDALATYHGVTWS